MNIGAKCLHSRSIPKPSIIMVHPKKFSLSMSYHFSSKCHLHLKRVLLSTCLLPVQYHLSQTSYNPGTSLTWSHSGQALHRQRDRKMVGTHPSRTTLSILSARLLDAKDALRRGSSPSAANYWKQSPCLCHVTGDYCRSGAPVSRCIPVRQQRK